MTLIASIDGPTRRVFLHADTAGADVHPIDVYKEMRTLRRSSESLRGFDLFMEAAGNVSKGGGKFTERFVTLLDGTRLVPFDTPHELTITGTIITDDGQEGIAAFDRSSLSVSTVVDINYVPPQVEVIEVQVGSAVTPQDILDIAAAVWDYATSAATTAGSMGEYVTKRLLTFIQFLGQK